MKVSTTTTNAAAALVLTLLLLLTFAPASISAAETKSSLRGGSEAQGQGGSEAEEDLSGNVRNLSPDNIFDRSNGNGSPGGNDGDVIEGSYIFVLRQDVSEVRGVISALTKDNPGLGPPFHVYENSIKGFSTDNLPPGLAKKLLDSSSDIAYVEENRVVSIDKRGGNGGGRKNKPTSSPTPSPTPAPPPEDKPYGITRVNGGAIYGGSNVAFVLDTGIADHPDLNVDRDRKFDVYGGEAQDVNGHGTHVAGTIAAIGGNGIGVIGVAAGATVVPVKVLSDSGSGTYAGVIAGIDYVADYGVSGDVANMSLGGGKSTAVNDAVVAASAKVKFAVAAGNNGASATGFSPASANGDNIFTVSAIDANDNFASFSNYDNPPIDWAAPGVAVKSTVPGGYATYSGTSMAAPHVAGVLLAKGFCTPDGTANNDPDGDADDICVM